MARTKASELKGRPHFTNDQNVEVFLALEDEEGHLGEGWVEGIVVGDSSGPSVEVKIPLFVDDKGCASSKFSVQQVQPGKERPTVELTKGSEVDVFIEDSWMEGKVVEVKPDSQYQVKLHHSPTPHEFVLSKQIRPGFVFDYNSNDWQPRLKPSTPRKRKESKTHGDEPAPKRRKGKKRDKAKVNKQPEPSLVVAKEKQQDATAEQSPPKQQATASTPTDSSKEENQDQHPDVDDTDAQVSQEPNGNNKDKDEATGKGQDEATEKDKDEATEKDKDEAIEKDKAADKDKDEAAASDQGARTTEDKETTQLIGLVNEVLESKDIIQWLMQESQQQGKGDKVTGAVLPEPADELFCPLTNRMMDDPVLAMDGATYERRAIEEWFWSHPLPLTKSPTTGDSLSSHALLSNQHVKEIILSWWRDVKAEWE